MRCICRYRRGDNCHRSACYPTENPKVCDLEKHINRYNQKMHGGSGEPKNTGLDITKADEFIKSELNTKFKNTFEIKIVKCRDVKPGDCVYSTRGYTCRDYSINDYSICLYKKKECVSCITLLHIGYKSDSYYVEIASKTRKEHGGNNYNLLMRSVVVMCASMLKYNGKPIKYVMSKAENNISVWLLMKYFGFKSELSRINKRLNPLLTNKTDFMKEALNIIYNFNNERFITLSKEIKESVDSAEIKVFNNTLNRINLITELESNNVINVVKHLEEMKNVKGSLLKKIMEITDNNDIIAIAFGKATYSDLVDVLHSSKGDVFNKLLDNIDKKKITHKVLSLALEKGDSKRVNNILTDHSGLIDIRILKVALKYSDSNIAGIVLDKIEPNEIEKEELRIALKHSDPNIADLVLNKIEPNKIEKEELQMALEKKHAVVDKIVDMISPDKIDSRTLYFVLDYGDHGIVSKIFDMIENGKVNADIIDSITLQIALEKLNTEIVSKIFDMIENGKVNANIIDSITLQIALQIALEKLNTEIVSKILDMMENGKVNTDIIDSKTLQIALGKSNTKMVSKILDIIDDGRVSFDIINEMTLRIAMEYQSNDVASRVLNIRGSDIITHDVFYTALEKSNTEIVFKILDMIEDNKVNTNIIDDLTLRIAMEYQSNDIALRVLNIRGSDIITHGVFYTALKKSNTEIVSKILDMIEDNKVNTNIIDDLILNTALDNNYNDVVVNSILNKIDPKHINIDTFKKGMKFNKRVQDLIIGKIDITGILKLSILLNEIDKIGYIFKNFSKINITKETIQFMEPATFQHMMESDQKIKESVRQKYPIIVQTMLDKSIRYNEADIIAYILENFSNTIPKETIKRFILKNNIKVVDKIIESKKLFEKHKNIIIEEAIYYDKVDILKKIVRMMSLEDIDAFEFHENLHRNREFLKKIKKDIIQQGDIG
jgi:hypothetical protein